MRGKDKQERDALLQALESYLDRLVSQGHVIAFSKLSIDIVYFLNKDKRELREGQGKEKNDI